MQHATITILDKECRALIFEGRTYVQPQFTGEVIGVVVGNEDILITYLMPIKK